MENRKISKARSNICPTDKEELDDLCQVVSKKKKVKEEERCTPPHKIFQGMKKPKAKRKQRRKTK